MTLPCLCIAGPTASGKSAAALAIAAALPAEIVSVDSAQVYIGMDIGTAKPGAAERAAVPHHLIDIVDPRDVYSAARFVADATRAIDAVRARGRVPLLVGGTMLYFKALWGGLDPLPAADAAVRAQIDALAAERGWPAVHAELALVDPISAARLTPNDRQRLQRALEVFRIAGRPLSQLQRGAKGATPPPMLSLEPQRREWLHERIRERFGAMLDAGLVDEVRALRARGDLHPALPSMRSVGYRQVWQMLDAAGARGAMFDQGSLATLSEREDLQRLAAREDLQRLAAREDLQRLAAREDLQRLAARGVAATRQLAKRQLTWLRGMAWREVVACDVPGATQRCVEWALRSAARAHG